MATIEEVKEDLLAKFGDFIFHTDEPFGLLTLQIAKEKLIEIVSYLKQHETFRFSFLTDICGIHWPDSKGAELGTIVHLHSLENNLRLRLKVFVPIEKPEIPSLTGLFNSANWMERETYDFFGIIFTGHPDLRRILNVDDMDYFPLRKEYPLEDPTRRDKNDSMFGR